jgi:T3SS (YopN, CesT) and YbjN peptide-binding chaperone 1
MALPREDAMTDPATLRAFLVGEVEALEPFGFLAIGPSAAPLHAVEVTRLGDGPLEVRVPGRPRALPELPIPVRSALRDRGFASEDPADPQKPWVHPVADPGAAVDLVRRLFTEVFEEKPDAVLDIAHGSHRLEHETRQRLAAVRERVEKVLKDLLGGKAPEQDGDGDYVLPVSDVHVVVAPRAAPGGPVVVRVFAICNVGVNVVPELGLFLARLNFGLMFGRFALDTEHRSIWFDETLLGDQFREEELRFAIDVVATTADQWDDRLKQMFGGTTYQEVLKEEVLKGSARQEFPPTKPGQGGYL